MTEVRESITLPGGGSNKPVAAITWAGQICGINYLELHGQWRVHYEKEKLYGTRCFRIKYTDLDKFLTGMFGSKAKLEHRMFSGHKKFEYLFAVDCEINISWEDRQRMDTIDTGSAVAGTALVNPRFLDITVHYEVIPDFSYKVEFSGDVINLDATKYKYSASGEVVDANLSRLVPTMDITVKFYSHQLSEAAQDQDCIDLKRMADHYGKINEKSIIFGGWLSESSHKFEAKELRFDNIEMTPTLYYGQDDYEYAMHFTFQRGGWNSMWESEQEDYKAIVNRDDTNKSVYETLDFAKQLMPKNMPYKLFQDSYRT